MQVEKGKYDEIPILPSISNRKEWNGQRNNNKIVTTSFAEYIDYKPSGLTLIENNNESPSS